MEFLEDGVKLNFEEYAEYQRALHALAALRNVTSFDTTSKPVEVEAWSTDLDLNQTITYKNTSTNTVSTKMVMRMSSV